MSRLDDVLARHVARKKMTSRKATLILVTIVVGVGIALELFTDLGTPNVPPPPPQPRATHVDDVKLMTPPARAKR